MGGLWLWYVVEIFGGIFFVLFWIGNNFCFFFCVVFFRYVWEIKVIFDWVEGKGNFFICVMECFGFVWYVFFGFRFDVVVKYEVN